MVTMSTKDERKTIVYNEWRKICDLVQNEPQIKEFTERDTRAVFVDPFLEALGWDRVKDVRRDYAFKTEKKYKPNKIKSNTSQFPDYGLQVDGKFIGLIEAKKFGKRLKDKDLDQVKIYAQNKNNNEKLKEVRWYILTDGVRLKFRLKENEMLDFDIDLLVDDKNFNILFDNFLWFICKEALSQNLLIGIDNQATISKLMNKVWEEKELQEFLDKLGHQCKNYFKLLADIKGKIEISDLKTKYNERYNVVFNIAQISANITKCRIAHFPNKEELYEIEDNKLFSIKEKYRKKIRNLLP